MVSGDPAVSSLRVKRRPRVGVTPRRGNVPSVTSRPRRCSGWPEPVTLTASPSYTPMSWSVVFCSRSMK